MGVFKKPGLVRKTWIQDMEAPGGAKGTRQKRSTSLQWIQVRAVIHLPFSLSLYLPSGVRKQRCFQPCLSLICNPFSSHLIVGRNHGWDECLSV